MKVFISQAMNGIPDEVVLARRQEIFDEVKKLHPDAELIESFVKNLPPGAGRIWYLGDSISMMDNADLVVFDSKSWSNARGCQVERFICTTYEIPYIDV